MKMPAAAEGSVTSVFVLSRAGGTVSDYEHARKGARGTEPSFGFAYRSESAMVFGYERSVFHDCPETALMGTGVCGSE